MRVAVTGASGHVGNCLCRALNKTGVRIKALVHNNEDDLEAMGVEMIRGDILDLDCVKRLCQDVDVVYHLAAKISSYVFPTFCMWNLKALITIVATPICNGSCSNRLPIFKRAS